MKKMTSLNISIPVGSKTKEDDLENIKRKTKDDKWYLNVNRANGALCAKWISPVLAKEDVKTRDEEIKFCEVHYKTKNIIECPTKEYGENLKSLMIDGLVLRYSLWLTQTNQSMKKPVFRYVPYVNYGEIHNDSELLSVCGFSEDEIKTVLDYLKDFKFDENRNDIVRDYEKREVMNVTDFDSENEEEQDDDQSSSPSTSESLPKTIYGLELKRLDPSSDIPEDEKYYFNRSSCSRKRHRSSNIKRKIQYSTYLNR